MSAKQSQSSVSDHNGTDLTNESTTTNSSSSSSSNSSWFKSLKRNLSSKRRGGRQARSGGNIVVPRYGGGNLNKSDWDICDSRTEHHMEIDFSSLKMSEKSVVSGLDLAHLQQSKGKGQ